MTHEFVRNIVVCEECGQPIPKARLQALPSTRLCVKCSDVKRKTVAEVDIASPADVGSIGGDNKSSHHGGLRGQTF